MCDSYVSILNENSKSGGMVLMVSTSVSKTVGPGSSPGAPAKNRSLIFSD